jgi:hypothetical protein
MAVYSIFTALGLDVHVWPVVELTGDDWRIIVDDDQDEEYDDPQDKQDHDTSYVGTALHEVVTTEAGGDDSYTCWEILNAFKGDWLPVTWLIDPVQANKNLGMVHLTVC